MSDISQKVVCPQCGGQMIIDRVRNSVKCNSCGEQLSIQMYIMSLQTFKKDLCILALKQILGQNSGVRISYGKFKNYIIGIDTSGELVILQQEKQLGQIGQIVEFNYNEKESTVEYI